MPHLLIGGAAGYRNIGDDAILEGMLHQLRAAVREAEFTVLGGPNLRALSESLGFTALLHEDQSAWLRAMTSADLVILGGGGLLYDSTFAPGLDELLKPRSEWLYQCARLASAAGIAGKKVVLFCVGVGPLLTESGRAAARFVAAQAEWVSTRDEHSASALLDLGIARSKVHVAADPAVLLESASAERALALAREAGLSGRRRPWVAVNVRPWFDMAGAGVGQQQRLRFQQAIAAACDSLATDLGASIIFLPMRSDGEDDAQVARQVVEAAQRPDAMTVLEAPCSPSEFQALVAQMDLVIGMRLHSLIFALNTARPFVALSYDPKVNAFAEAAGMRDFCLPIEGLSGRAVAERAAAALGKASEIAANLEQAHARLVERAEVSSALVGATLESASSVRQAGPAPVGSVHVDERRPIRVLMQIRPDYQESMGGDAVQMLSTKAALQGLGVEVGVCTDAAPDLSAWDLVHAFNVTRPRETVDHCSNAQRQGKPVVLSTIYWDMREYIEQARRWLDPACRAGAADLAELARREAQAAVALRMADLLLPNSQAEKDLLERNFGVAPGKCLVVPNAVDDRFFDADPGQFVSEYGISDFVLCVGRLEPRKNQHALLAALRETDIPIVLIGPRYDREYAEACRASARNGVTFIEHIPHDRLPSAYAAARVHVLPSWYDTPGLVSLEAAAAGCNVVSTDRGAGREYFGDMAWYCDPASIDSIREAVLAAWRAPKSGKLKEFVRANYTWPLAARKTLEAYRIALALAPAETADGRAARLSGQVQAYSQYVRAQEEYITVLSREYERNVAALRQAYDDLNNSAQDAYRRLKEAYEAKELEVQQRQREILERDREIEAITSRRLYRLSERLALLLRRAGGKGGRRPMSPSGGGSHE